MFLSPLKTLHEQTQIECDNLSHKVCSNCIYGAAFHSLELKHEYDDLLFFLKPCNFNQTLEMEFREAQLQLDGYCVVSKTNMQITPLVQRLWI